jgi:hypothetical protein
LLQQAGSYVSELLYVKQIGDQDPARCNLLAYEGYIKFLLSVFSTFDKKVKLPGKEKRAVYTAEITGEDGRNLCDGTVEGVCKFFKNVYNLFDDILEKEYEIFEDVPDPSDIMIKSTNSNHFGIQHTTGDGKPKAIFLPPEQWINMKQEQTDQFIVKHCQENLDDKPIDGYHQASMNEVSKYVNLYVVKSIITDLDVIQQADKVSEDEVPS